MASTMGRYGNPAISSYVIDADGYYVANNVEVALEEIYVTKNPANQGYLSGFAVTDEGGLNISWTAGTIFDFNNQQIVIVAAGTGACTTDTINYLYWDAGATLAIGIVEPTGNQVLIAEIYCQSNDIFHIMEMGALDRREHWMMDALDNIFPNIVTNGLTVTEDPNAANVWDVQMAAGTFYHNCRVEHAVAAIVYSRITAMRRWYHVAGAWTSDTNAEIDITQYDNGANLVAVTPARYHRSVFFTDGMITHWVYPQAEYATVAAAIDAPDPTLPPGLQNLPKLTAVVIRTGDAAFPAVGSDQWIDVRPMIGQAVGAPVSDHGGLSGLADDDHLLYLLIDGTRAMTGNLTFVGAQTVDGVDISAISLSNMPAAATGNIDCGGQAITNVGNVDGVDVSAIVAFTTITGITNDVVADALTDTLTLSSANALLTIVGTAATDTIEWTVVEANFVLDGNTIQIDGINSDGGAFAFNTTGIVTFNQDVTVPNLITAGNVDGVDVSALNTAYLAHLHNTQTLQLDGINSDGGAFSFTTTGTVTFNQAVTIQGLLTTDGLVPEGDLADSLGTAALTWLDLFVQDIKDAAGNVILSNDGAGVIDALANLSCNIVFTGAQTVDGVDISAISLSNMPAAASGNIDCGGQAITNVGNVDGVDVSAIVAFTTITGITNDVVADGLTDTLTLSSANALLTIVGTAVTDTIQWTVVEGNFVLDGNTVQIDGINSDGGAFAFDTTGAVTFNQNIAFTGAQTVDGVDISAFKTAYDAHLHDTQTLQLDGINSDGGAFTFNTTGTITFNQMLAFTHAIAGMLDLNPANTGTQTVIDITPSANLAAASVWYGINQDWSNLDPATGVGCDLYGIRIDASGMVSFDGDAEVYGIYFLAPAESSVGFEGVLQNCVAGEISTTILSNLTDALGTTSTYRGFHVWFLNATRTANAPVLEGILVELPANYANFGVSYAGYFSGDGRSVTICDTTYALDVSGAMNLVGAITGVTSINLIEDDVYGAGWNGDTTHAPSQNAVYDKINAMDTLIAANTTPAEAIAAVVAENPLTLTNALSIGSIVAGVADYDKFLVSDGGLVKFRTGAEVLSDIGASASGHLHDGQTLQADGINSDGGAFSFSTTGAITFNNALAGITTLSAGTGTFEIAADGYITTYPDMAVGADNYVLTYDHALGTIKLEVLPPAGPHTHDGDTLQLDGVNSDGGAFSFTTTGTVTFNQAVIVQGLLTADGLVPEGDLADSLGTAALTWLDLFVQDIKDAAGNVILSNDGAGVIDALANLSCNIVFTGAQTVDGVDISAHDADVNAHHAQSHTIVSHSDATLADPGADQIVFWDDSDSKFEFLVANTGLSIAGNNLNCDITQYTDGLAKAACVSDAIYGAGWNGVLDVAPSKNAVYDQLVTHYADANEHHAQVHTMNSHTATSLADPGVDRIVFWDESDNTFEFLVANTGLSIAGNNLNCDITQYTDGLARTACVSDVAYGAAWNAVTTIAPSKNAIYDATKNKIGYPEFKNYEPGNGAAVYVGSFLSGIYMPPNDADCFFGCHLRVPEEWTDTTPSIRILLMVETAAQAYSWKVTVTKIDEADAWSGVRILNQSVLWDVAATTALNIVRHSIALTNVEANNMLHLTCKSDANNGTGIYILGAWLEAT